MDVTGLCLLPRKGSNDRSKKNRKEVNQAEEELFLYF